MRKNIALGVASTLAFVSLSVSTAFAWSYSIKGTGACQADGSFRITWVVNNSSEPQPLKITATSSPLVVPVGTQIPAGQQKTFTQSVDGTKPATFTLSLTGHWQGDRSNHNQHASVTLAQACTQPTPPVTPPAGGMGGGSTTDTTTPTAPTPATQPVAAQPQVSVAPVGAVNAGAGTRIIGLGALAGLIGALLAFGLGARGLKKAL